jgi:hypothetical protein
MFQFIEFSPDVHDDDLATMMDRTPPAPQVPVVELQLCHSNAPNREANDDDSDAEPQHPGAGEPRLDGLEAPEDCPQVQLH